MSTFVDALRAEYRQDSPFVAVSRPRVSWVTRSDVPGWVQLSAELEWDDGSGPVTTMVEGNASVFVSWPFEPLGSRGRGMLRVRTRGADGWTPWSTPAQVAAGFLAVGEWQAQFIGLPAPSRAAQPALLRTEFEVDGELVRATLYATAQGVYQASINGADVDEETLKPGWTPYHLRLIHETTDVTGLVRPGRNALAVAVAAGWYAERFGFHGLERSIWGEQPSFAGQVLLEYADGREVWVVSDESWRASDQGPWLASGLYAGETFDAGLVDPGWNRPGFDAAGWQPAATTAGPVPAARYGPVVRATQRLAVAEVITSATGRTILDFGQNLVGRLRIRVSGPRGQAVTLRHAEVLEDGELGTRPLRRAAATDTYVLAGGGTEVWEPSFTFHGFRYTEVEGWPGEFSPADVDAVVIHSDMVRSGWFECSDPLLSRLHENVVWGMRGNFLSIPTDCPQRDERLGWTGDIQVFSPTAAYLFDSDGFLASWLEDLALEQTAGGGVPFVVPDVLDSASTPAAAWGDAATVVPWVLYQRFGDQGVLRAQYPSMKAWADLVLTLAGERQLWEGGFQFGDWLDPDAPADQPAKTKTDPDLVASAHVFWSASLVAKAAEVLGDPAAAADYRARAEAVRQAWLAEYVTPAGRILSDSQTAYALAIEFGLVGGDLRRQFGERLAWLVRRDGYRIGTGFVGTPLVTDALSRTGHLRQAARLLLQRDCPSWLYPVTMGATTIWERWDSMLPDGSINPGEMTSFNHYAFGAVADWIHRVIGGLSPAAPGYRVLEVAPRPIPGLTWARTRHETPYGTATVEWERVDGQVTVRALVPANASALVSLPDGSEVFEVAAGSHEWVVALAPEPEPGPVGETPSLAEVMDDPEAYGAVVAAMNRMSPAAARDFLRRTAWVPNRLLFDAFSMVDPAIMAAVRADLGALDLARQR